MAKGWTNNRRCPICDGSGWGKSRCRGFEHRDGGAVYCERPDDSNWDDSSQRWGYEKTEVVISPFGIPLTCFRKVIS
jgi:hypothetical protein